MTSRVLPVAFLVLTSSLVGGQMSYGSDLGRTPSQKKAIDDALSDNEGTEERIEKRKAARKMQVKGKKLKSNIEATQKPAAMMGGVLSSVASASGDPHAKVAAAAINVSIKAIQELGKGVAAIVIGVGRYQERSQEILNTTEALIEDVQKSSEKKESLEKKLDQLLKVEKLPEASQSSSTLKKLATGAANTIKTSEIKVRQATDVFTNDKSKREEKIKEIQVELKSANEDYLENIRLLQILLMQDALKEINKKLNVNNPDPKLNTIAQLKKDKAFYLEARAKENLSKNKSKQTKQIGEIDKKEKRMNEDLVYYLEYQKDPVESEEQLMQDKNELINKIKELAQVTKLGNSTYLQERGIQLDSDVNKKAIVGIYKEIDVLQNQYESLKNQLETLAKTIASKDVKPLPSVPLKQNTLSQPEKKDGPNDVEASGKGVANPAGAAMSRETIKAQLEALRKTTPRTDR